MIAWQKGAGSVYHPAGVVLATLLLLLAWPWQTQAGESGSYAPGQSCGRELWGERRHAS
jgi:hypothetical protein